MAREHARVKLSIWEDDDFRALPSDAQHLYFVLMTSPKLDYAGVTDWRPSRIAPLVADWTVDRVEQAAQILAENLYIIIDDESEEVLLRSFVRNDELLESPNMAVAMRKAHAGIASGALRSIIVHELVRLYKDKPDLKGWAKVSELLDRPSLNPSEYPSFRASGNPSGNPSESRDPNPSEDPSVSTSPTTAPTPAPATAPPSGGRANARRSKIPADWKPNPNDIDWQREQRIPDSIAREQLPIFVDHWTGKGEPRADWSATWRNWLRRQPQFDRSGGNRQPAPTHLKPWEV
jgi:hypothetical protein